LRAYFLQKQAKKEEKVEVFHCVRFM
jgi:hypothetical protein